ncbi:tyrosine-type recombinase/integrase [Natronocalculus amylovorans]|uniref:Tyrosine-type recombinase/integrase n=1 Tax=Natronocalculus amylovorans TaxID=2917812 RepID=A0AAE3G0I0_9EURY|nr:tyrosine-type recombinase/integrase [Natronocalculus amylovorans]MCL9818343.1 tyrosine-type recombinase/integrase [Natronocalculus amylovorans]
MSDQINWSRMSLEELTTFYHTQIEPTMERHGLDPTTDRPSYSWLTEHGYSGIAYTLREHHNLTIGEFVTQVVGVTPRESDGYEWGIDDQDTIEYLEQYLSSRKRRHQLADSTIASKRSRLARYVRTYEALHGDAALVGHVESLDTQTQEITRAIEVFDQLNEELNSDDSKQSHLADLNDWYMWLQNRAIAAFNPAPNVASEFSRGWNPDTETKPALSAAQIRSLVAAAETTDERFIVTALGAWGLRRGEVAALHVSQFVPNADPPRVEFDERKNGPSDVQLLFGLEAYYDRVDEMETSEWNGYLLPSSSSKSGHIHPGTVNDRFRRIADRAEVRLEGERPTPHACRRFWYNAYQSAVQELHDRIEPIADDQGSRSTQVVIDEYLGKEEARQVRRELMHDALSEAFIAEK